MPGKLSYADAAKLLGGADSALVAALDKVTGGLLLAATAGAGELVLSLFDAKGELARLSGELVGGLEQRLRGLNRIDRTLRLAAAQRVLVLTAYFEAVRELELPFRLDRTMVVGATTGQAVPVKRLAALAGVLADADLPGHSPRDRLQATGESLERFYRSLGEDLLQYVQSLPVWRDTTRTEGERLARALDERAPATAARRYEELFRRLAAEFPEVAFWANQLDHEATRAELRELATSMEGLGLVLERIATGNSPDERRSALAQRYRRQLERPIVATGDVPEGLVIPSLADGYINPDYRVASATRSDPVDEEWWWGRHPLCRDLQGFLIGHLTSPHAVECPLVVLGQPGSGKSVLTKVLAARLPPTDFLTVRVALREVPADIDLQAQIEHAIRDATGEHLSWPALARAAGDALPVVLLDGFDELLQATNIGQSDFLEQIARFQEREADQDRPVAVLVTSRTAVADRGRIPLQGAVVVRLEPFTDDQVRNWLDIWNGANTAYWTARRLLPLAGPTVLRQRELATQPLLLLMLALYDATGNALQRAGEGLDPADLYERILLNFAEREIRKTRPQAHGDRLTDAMEEELLRLSIAAFAMFNRGRQWVTERELTDDLEALLPESTPPAGRDFSAAATAGQSVISRFFFIHQAKAIRAGQTLTTCEFLHATLGEFLIARLIVRELADLAAVAEAATVRDRGPTDVSFLRALLSFGPLTIRASVIGFLSTLIGRLPEHRKTLLRGLLLTHIAAPMIPATNVAYGGYEPVPAAVPEHYAAYSANLVLLAVLVGQPVAGRELFPHSRFPASAWRKRAMFWRSRFSGEGWRSLAATLRVERVWHAGDRDIVLTADTWDPPRLDPFWTHKMVPGHRYRDLGSGWSFISAEALRRESYFTCDIAGDLAWHAVEPFTDLLDGVNSGEALAEFAVTESGEAISVVRALVALWLASGAPGGELVQAYRDCVRVIQGSRAPEQSSGDVYLVLVLRQLAADAERLPAEFLDWAYDTFARSLLLRTHHESDVLSWTLQAFGDRVRDP